jgi:leucyl-tRNA synthetase
MHSTYQATAIEKAVQQVWNDGDVYRATENDPRFPKGKFYACSMLPYPSGKLHMGHVRNYTINDMMYRHLRMNGYNVLMPMGWDAFGLPAENAAMKNKVAPATWTYSNIAYMKQQMQAMGLAVDWHREVATCSPEYYKWNQWLFLKMLEKGIAYRKTGTVNWDPVDQTVLANEQVIDGRGWRSGAVIEKREIPMYYLGITQYAEELLNAVDDSLPGWPDRVRTMQSNWIGKSVGVRFAFPHQVKDGQGQLIQDGKLYVFTTRADTIMGVTFVAVAPEHPLATLAAQSNPAIATFIADAKAGSVMEADMATMEKKGIDTGLQVQHPLTGESINVWVGNYVLMSYGDGAVMGVPAHDERDLEFANKYKLPVKQVIDVGGQAYDTTAWQDWYGDKNNGRCIESGAYNGLKFGVAIEAIATDLKAKGLGDKKVQWRLRDWGISRQRYWGTPVPLIHCDDCGVVPVPYKDLPVVLPEDLIPDGSGNPLNKASAFLNCTCPKCAKPARRETDTMDTFIDSSWYFMRYCSPDNKDFMVDSRADYWMPMDQYIGGIEHAILHLLYARFWTKVMRDIVGEFPPVATTPISQTAPAGSNQPNEQPNSQQNAQPTAQRGLVQYDEPFTKLLCQGMVLNHIYSRKGGVDGKGGIEYFWPHDVENILGETGQITGARLKSDGQPVDYGGVGTMSKSKSNGVDPQSLIDQYGADTARLFVMFASPPEQTLEWSDAGVEGGHRFLKRVWALGVKLADAKITASAVDFSSHTLNETQQNLRREVHNILRQADYDFKRIQYNTVVSAGMKMLNAIEAANTARGDDSSAQWQASLGETFSVLLRMLYPVVPHLTYQLWIDLGYQTNMGDLLNAAWPQVDEAALKQDVIELILQVNGKVRGAIKVAADAEQNIIEAAALASEAFIRFSEGKPARKVIVVKGRLVNIVV